MALSEFEARRAAKIVAGFVETRRPPPHLRHEIDLAYVIEGQSVVLLERRKLWDNSMSEHAVAKATWVKTQKQWKIYWQRADLKWHSYQPQPTVASIEEFCAIVQEDVHACFWG